jgi:xylose dehydrogenase (NAD/NADP)
MDVEGLLADLTRRDWDVDTDGVVRFAVVGLGRFARNSALPAIAESQYCAATAVVSGDPGKAGRVADEYEAAALTYDEFHDGVAAGEYDAVYVCTPNALHLPHAEAAAALGKDVLCEKPLEASAERAERLVEACDDAGVRLFTAYRMQAEPATRRMRELVARGFVGDPVFAHGAFTFPLSDAGWRVDPDLSGGAAMMDVGVYPLNTARFLLDADPTTVSAHTAPGGYEGVDGDVALQASFPDDVTLHARASFSAAPDSYVEVKGREGRVRLDFAFAVAPERTLTLQRDGYETTVEGIATNEVVEEFDYVATRILADEPASLDGRDGLTDVRIADAVYESADGAGVVDLTDRL